jgi:hypothetical protein
MKTEECEVSETEKLMREIHDDPIRIDWHRDITYIRDESGRTIDMIPGQVVETKIYG